MDTVSCEHCCSIAFPFRVALKKVPMPAVSCARQKAREELRQRRRLQTSCPVHADGLAFALRAYKMSEVGAGMATACEGSPVDVGARRWVTHCSASKYATIETPPPHTAVSMVGERVQAWRQRHAPPTHTISALRE